MKIEDEMRFYQSLGFLLQAGLPLMNALEKTGVQSMLRGIQEGRSLAEVLNQHACHLSCVQMIRIGEQSGQLTSALIEASEELQELIKNQTEMKRALQYPCFVMALAISILAGMLYWVVPSFASMFTQFNAELPKPTQVLLTASENIQSYGLWVLLSFTVIFLSARTLLVRHRGCQQFWDYLLVRLPVIGPLLGHYLCQIWAQQLARLLRSGMSLPLALLEIAQYSNHWVVHDACLGIHSQLSLGHSLAHAVQRTHLGRLLRPSLVQLIEVAEASSQLDSVLLMIGQEEKRQWSHSITQLNKNLEPALILFLGMILVMMISALYLPIFEMGHLF